MSARVFALRFVPKEEADGVRDALDEAGIPFYETPNSLLSDYGIWVTTEERAVAARAVIDAFQAEWRRKNPASPVRQEDWRATLFKLLVTGIGLWILYRVAVFFVGD